MTIKLVEVKHCPECMEREGDLVLDTIYECQNCGTKFAREVEGSHKCPDCSKFAEKMTDEGCQECCEELVEDECWECGICSKLHNTAVEAYECCSKGAGEPEPEEVTQ